MFNNLTVFEAIDVKVGVVLTSNLRDLEAKGIVKRKVYPEVPPRVEYSLTELGHSLKPILDSMWDWGEWYKTQQA
ncbi:TPA: winged helix-turn-helix transcriptional regulator [Streptococcus suis]|nr:winged helix-turn-helix transcriptional regulator [Streptococcus suis]